MHYFGASRALWSFVRGLILTLVIVHCQAGTAAERPDPVRCGRASFAVPYKTGEAWSRTRSSMISGIGSPKHRLYDVLTVAGTPVTVVGKFTYGPLDKDLEGEKVELWGTDPTTCAWKALGRSETENHGTRRPTDFTQLDDGEARWQLPATNWPAGAYSLHAVVLGDLSEVQGTLYLVPKGSRIVVFDIDGTLAEEAQDAAGMMATVIAGVESLRRFEGTVETVQQWAQAGVIPVFLTGRHGSMKAATVRWLERMGFPKGPVVVARTGGDVMPSASGVQRYKAEQIKGWLKQGLVVAAAYGNATTDIGAYADAGLPKARTFIVGPHRGSQATAKWPGYTKAHIEWVKKEAKAR